MPPRPATWGANGTTPTAADLVKGLQSLKGDTLDGWAPPLTFAAHQPHPVDCWFTTEVKNGQFQMPIGLSQDHCSNGSAATPSSTRVSSGKLLPS
jgi:branched-chain amino acid transport system substrate-binding protein